jgi:hypothetical protein
VSSSTTFNPSAPLEAQIFEALISKDHSLTSIAALAATTTEALSLWLARPDIRDRVAGIESTAAWRIRITCTVHLQAAVSALLNVLHNPTLNAIAFSDPSRAAGSPPSAAATGTTTQQAISTEHSAPSTDNPLASIRAAESIRRSASTLVRLARFKPIGPTAVVPLGTPPLRSGSDAPTPAPRSEPAPTTTPHAPNPALTALLDKHATKPGRANNQPVPRLAGMTSGAQPRSTHSLAAIDRFESSPASRADSQRPPNRAATLLQAAGSARGP